MVAAEPMSVKGRDVGRRTAGERTLTQRTRRAAAILWSVAGVLLIVSIGVLFFTSVQSIAFNIAQMAPDAVNVRPSFWLQVFWMVQGLPGILVTVAFVCAVAPFFLFAVAAHRPTVPDDGAERPIEEP